MSAESAKNEEPARKRVICLMERGDVIDVGVCSDGCDDRSDEAMILKGSRSRNAIPASPSDTAFGG